MTGLPRSQPHRHLEYVDTALGLVHSAKTGEGCHAGLMDRAGGGCCEFEFRFLAWVSSIDSVNAKSTDHGFAMVRRRLTHHATASPEIAESTLWITLPGTVNQSFNQSYATAEACLLAAGQHLHSFAKQIPIRNGCSHSGLFFAYQAARK